MTIQPKWRIEMSHETNKKGKNPMGAWWRNMTEKTHRDKTKYNKKAERRLNRIFSA
jgi:hypothetical protein